MKSKTEKVNKPGWKGFHQTSLALLFQDKTNIRLGPFFIHSVMIIYSIDDFYYNKTTNEQIREIKHGWSPPAVVQVQVEGFKYLFSSTQ